MNWAQYMEARGHDLNSGTILTCAGKDLGQTQELSVSTVSVPAKTPDTVFSHIITNIPDEKMEATDFPKTLVVTYETTPCHTSIFKL
jgi:hypothetical protein